MTQRASLLDISNAAKLVPCGTKIFQAIMLKESFGDGFDETGFPTCLVEPHIIWRHATPAERGRLAPFRLAYPDQGQYPYGTYAEQKQKFQRVSQVASLDLAILGTSFGITQILGENYALAGFETPYLFYKSMCMNEACQLEASATMMHKNASLVRALDSLNFLEIAEYWNGRGAGAPRYAAQLKRIYEHIA